MVRSREPSSDRESPRSAAGRSVFLLLAVGALLFGHAPPLQAQRPAAWVARFAEEEAHLVLLTEIIQESLGPSQQKDFQVELPAGSAFTAVAYCDENCGDLDLILLDPEGTGVDSDIFPNAEPMLTFTTETAGAYRIRVAMVGCSFSQCDFALGLFQGSGFDAEAMDLPKRVSSLAEEYGLEGYSDLQIGEAGSLAQDHELRFPLWMEEGVEYQIAGVCDENCTSLGLALFDPDGFEVAADRLGGEISWLSLSTGWTAAFRLGVEMAACRAESCAFQVAVFGRGDRVGPGGVILEGEVVNRATIPGALEEGDERSEQGSYVDEYSVEAIEGQLIIADLTSSDFVTRIRIVSPTGRPEQTADQREDEYHTHTGLVARETGVYTVRVTTPSPMATGSYRLEVAVVERDPSHGHT